MKQMNILEPINDLWLIIDYHAWLCFYNFSKLEIYLPKLHLDFGFNAIIIHILEPRDVFHWYMEKAKTNIFLFVC